MRDKRPVITVMTEGHHPQSTASDGTESYILTFMMYDNVEVSRQMDGPTVFGSIIMKEISTYNVLYTLTAKPPEVELRPAVCHVSQSKKLEK